MTAPARKNAVSDVIELDRARELQRQQAEDELILDPSDPFPDAEEYVRRHHTAEGVRTLHEQSGVFYGFRGTHYGEVEDAEIRAALWKYGASAFRWSKGKEPVLIPFQPTSPKVNNILDAVRGLVHLPARYMPPCWIDGDADVPADEVIAAANGILHVPTRRLLPATPRLYTHNAVPFPFLENAPTPVAWLEFLHQLWGDDLECIQTLQEIFGYLQLPDTRQQKAFLLVGPKRSGKGTIARILNALLGSENVCAPTLAGLSTNFGLQPLIGKLLAVISDARLGGRADQAAIAERLLAISGEDTVTVDRKHRPSWTGRLPTRFLILSNELPSLSDTSGALTSRFIVLTLERSFYGHEDPHLTEKLMAELPGIFAWALEGWDRLHRRGHFVQPASADDAIREMQDLGSPVAAFIRDRCRVEPGRRVECKAMYEAWRHWCNTEGRDHAGTSATLGRNLRTAVPGVKRSQPRIGGERVPFYEGIDLSSGF